MITTKHWSLRDNADVRVHIKDLKFTLKNHVFDGNDSITIFDLLTRFAKEDDILNVSEAQALNALPNFLADPTETQFRTNLSGASLHGVMICWEKAIQYLLRTYATASDMREVLDDLHNFEQKAVEKEELYCK